MNKETRTWIIGLLIFIVGAIEILVASYSYSQSNYFYAILAFGIGVYCLYNAITMIKKTIL